MPEVLHVFLEFSITLACYRVQRKCFHGFDLEMLEEI